jgi:nucleotide-binding universal stress UspA family protein
MKEMRILAGIDLAMEGHDWLLARASAFAQAAQARLDLLYVSSDDSKLPVLEEMLEQIPEACRGSATIIPGDPLDELIRLSNEVDAMVIGPREPTGLDRYLQGAMAVRVLHRTACPVYVPRTSRFGQRKVRMLVGLDLESSRVNYVLRTAHQWAERLDASTVDGVYAVPRSMPAIRRPEIRAAALKEWAANHEPMRVQLVEALNILSPERRGDASVSPGEPEDILVTDSEHYDLVLVGNRTRGGLTGMLLGGVARHVVRNAKCDILIMPTASQPDEK